MTEERFLAQFSVRFDVRILSENPIDYNGDVHMLCITADGRVVTVDGPSVERLTESGYTIERVGPRNYRLHPSFVKVWTL